MHRTLIALAVLAGTAHAGTIKGKVTFKGTVPDARPADRSNDTFCAGTTPVPHVDVHDGKLGGVYVRIKNGSFKDATPAPADPVVITQSKCEYAPRVVGAIAGQKLEIHNDDPTFHNVRIVGTDGKLLLNKPQQKGAAPITTDAIEGDGVVELHCDVHSWMQSWVVVADHSHFTVTGDDGSFTLSGVPAGTYTVEAWHPDLGWKTTKVKVKKGKKVAKAKLQYSLDDCTSC